MKAALVVVTCCSILLDVSVLVELVPAAIVVLIAIVAFVAFVPLVLTALSFHGPNDSLSPSSPLAN